MITNKKTMALAAFVVAAANASAVSASDIGVECGTFKTNVTTSMYYPGSFKWGGECMAAQKPGGGCERYSRTEPTVAHKTLPFGTMVTLIRTLPSGKKLHVRARVNDRGPYVKGRHFDANKKTADSLGFNPKIGLIKVDAIICFPNGSPLIKHFPPAYGRTDKNKASVKSVPKRVAGRSPK